MEHRIPIRIKLGLAFGLNLFFYGVILYVNLAGEDRLWSNLIGKNLPIIVSEYIVGALLIFGWLFLAERIHEQFERWFGEEIISKGGFWPNLAALVSFAAANVMVNRLGILLIYWLQTQLLAQPDVTILETTEYARMSLRFNYVNYLIMALFVYYLLTYRRVVKRLNQATLRAGQAQKNQVEAQYALLQNRVNPHFLFNSLSTLASLAQVDSERSEQFIQHLSKAYRYMLESRQSPTVPLRDELEFLRSYTFLQQQRFGSKFRIEADIAPEALRHFTLVPLTLQALTERALKTNRMSLESPLVVKIRTAGDQLVVENNRQPRQEPDTTVGSCDWETFEAYYNLLTQADQGPEDHWSEQRWVTRVPLFHSNQLPSDE